MCQKTKPVYVPGSWWGICVHILFILDFFFIVWTKENWRRQSFLSAIFQAINGYLNVEILPKIPFTWLSSMRRAMDTVCFRLIVGWLMLSIRCRLEYFFRQFFGRPIRVVSNLGVASNLGCLPMFEKDNVTSPKYEGQFYSFWGHSFWNSLRE